MLGIFISIFDLVRWVAFWQRLCLVWRGAVSWFVSVAMVLTSLPLSVLVPQVAYAAAADAVLTGAPTGSSNVTTLNVTVGSDNGVTHYKYDVVAGTACTNLTLSASTAIATKITEDISSSGSNIADGSVSLCVAGSTDGTTFDDTPTKATWTKDTAPPTIASGTYGGTTVQLTMSEAVYGTAEANDFTVVNDSTNNNGTNVTPSGIAIAATKAAKSPTITLTVPETTWTGTVKVYYTQDSDSTKRVKDGADNVMADLASGSAETLTAATAPTAPSAIELTTPSTSPGNDTTPTFTVTVGETGGTVTLYSDSSCSSANAVSSATSVTDNTSPYAVAVTTNVYSTDGAKTVYAKHTKSGLSSTCSTATGSYTLDTAPPTIASGKYGGTTVELTMSEAVYGTAEANDFTVVNSSDGTPANVTPSGITIAATKATKSPTITLTVPETTWTGTVKIYYTQDTDSTKRVKDGADNVLASIASGSAETLTAATAPSATLTGAPTGSSATTVLDVTVGGTDVTHYRQYMIAGSSCVDTSTTTANASDYGAAATATRLYFAGFILGTGKVRAYNYDYTEVTAEDITLHSDNGDASGLETDGTTMWVLDRIDSKIYAYTISTKARDTTKDVTLHADNDGGSGLTKTATHFYVADRTDNKVYAYTTAGTRAATKDFAIDPSVEAIANDGTYLYTAVEPFANAYRLSDGARVPARDVYIGTTYQSGIYGAMVHANSGIYAVGTDQSTNEKLKYAPLPSAETAVATKITRNISALADGSASLCAAGKNDIGQWQGAPTKATWTKDTAPPTLSSAVYDGQTVTVTMSEDVYAATAPTASDFKVKVGSNANVVTGITGLPTVKANADNSFDLTVTTSIVSGSTVKVYYDKGTNAVTDEAGNELADLAEASAITAVESAAPAAPTLALQSPSTSPGNDSTPTIRVTVDTNQQNGTVELFSDNTCATSISSSVTVDAATEDVTTTALTEGAPTHLRKTHQQFQ